MIKKINSTFKKIDNFGEPISLLAEKSATHQTVQGAIITLLIYMTVMIYGSSKFNLMIEREDTLF